MRTIKKIFLVITSILILTASTTLAGVEYVAGPSPSGDLLVFFWSPQDDWQVVNVSQITGQKIAGSVTNWQTKDGSYTVEHFAGPSPSGDLLVFFWSPQADWQVVNVSQITGQKITGPVTNWQTPDGPFIVEHLAGPSEAGDLLVFWRRSDIDWQVVNVSQITGQKITGPMISWQLLKDGFNVEHLAGPGPSGDLLVFFWSPQADWQVVNVSQITGQKITGPVTNWQTPDGPFIVEHLAGPSEAGDLLVFWRRSDIDWQVVNVSQITGQKITGPMISWVMENIEHLAAPGMDKKLYVFRWTPATDWYVVSVDEFLMAP